jgi:hypothetical protein
MRSPNALCVGFTGTQYGMTERQKEVLWKLLRRIEPMYWRVGDCIGSDKESVDVILRMAWTYRDGWRRPTLIGHPPTDDSKRAFCKYDEEMPPAPYRERDGQIAILSNVVIATPRRPVEELRSGTWATARDAYRAGTGVLIIWPEHGISDIWPDGSCPQCRAWGRLSHSCFRANNWLHDQFTVLPFTFTHARRK